MKKKVLALLLPLTAGVALTGTGFGIWVFNDTAAQKVYGQIGLTPAIEVNGLTISNKSTINKIILDQNDSKLSQRIEFQLDTKSFKDISITQDDVTVKFQIDCSADLPKISNTNTDPNTCLSTYIKLSKVEADQGVTEGGLTQIPHIYFENDDYTKVFGKFTIKAEDVNPTKKIYGFALTYYYAWIDGKIPTTATDYNKVRDILKADSTIDYTFTVNNIVIVKNS